MRKAIYPIYVQEDSITSLYGQMFELAEQSRKIAHAKGATKTTEKKVSLVLSLLQLLGLEGSFRRENSESSDYTEEIMQIVGPEDRLRFIRKELTGQGVLYNLNLSLKKGRPFGSFVDFQGKATFTLIPSANDGKAESEDEVMNLLLLEKSKFVKVEGQIEDYEFTTVCSMKYLKTSSWLYHILYSKSDKQVPIVGFGVVTDFDTEKKTMAIKALMLALSPESFRAK